MKILMKPVEMIAWFTRDGVPNPLKYKLQNENKENVTISVQRIILRQEEKLAGNRMFIFRCQSIIGGVERIFELKYEINTCKWFLYKM
ncbi:MAG: hypothetical protein N2645_03645 [Clostridia bacterium]|nr:hypothetical protein [Clostridia bacterium]